MFFIAASVRAFSALSGSTYFSCADAGVLAVADLPGAMGGEILSQQASRALALGIDGHSDVCAIAASENMQSKNSAINFIILIPGTTTES